MCNCISPPQYSCILLFRIFIAVHGPCTMATPTVLGGSVLSLSDSDLGGGVVRSVDGDKRKRTKLKKPHNAQRCDSVSVSRAVTSLV